MDLKKVEALLNITAVAPVPHMINPDSIDMIKTINSSIILSALRSKDIDSKITNSSDHRILISKGLTENNEVNIIIKPSSKQSNMMEPMEQPNENVLEDHESKRIEQKENPEPDASNRMDED